MKQGVCVAVREHTKNENSSNLCYFDNIKKCWKNCKFLEVKIPNSLHGIFSGQCWPITE